MYLRIFRTFIFLSGMLDNCLAAFEPAYLRVCGKELKYNVESNVCDKGVWLKQPIEPGCVCVRGVWAISSGFCDKKAAILVGDGHCFDLSYEIRSAKLIGDPRDPFRPKIYVAPKTLDAFYELKESGHTPPLTSDETIVIGINPRQVAQRKDFGVCLDLEPEEWAKPVHIFENPRRSAKEWILDQKKTYTCATLTPYPHHVGFGEQFARDKVSSKLLVQRQCKQDCLDGVGYGSSAPGASPAGPQGRSLGSSHDWQSPGTFPSESRGNFKSKPASTIGRKMSSRGRSLSNSPPKKPVKTMEERLREREEARAMVTQDRVAYEKETNEQTLRMMHAHIEPLLLGITGPQVLTTEYQYFQQLRIVTEKACPEEFVPKKLLRGLMRMFRQLLWETQDTFTHTQAGDKDQYNRTLTVLEYCAKETPDPSVLFATYTESWNNDTIAGTYNETMPLPTVERCPSPIMFGVNGSEYNSTTINPKNKFIQNITGWFKPHLKFNSSQVDYVIEAAWKMVVIGSFRCLNYFNGTTAVDYSNFFHQVQSFFNAKIVKRWYYEKSIEATFKVVQMIFPSFDLKKFMFGLDACYFGVKGFSDLELMNIWLERPKIPGTPNDFSLRKNVLPGSGSPLSTLDYAPDKPKILGRRKRRSTNQSEVGSAYTLWDENAKCMLSYMEPLTRKDLGYHLPFGCSAPTTS